MRQVYSRSFTVTFATGDSGYVLSDRIDPGYVLRVRSCYAYSPEREASDAIYIGIRDGATDIVHFMIAPVATLKGSDMRNELLIGEGDQVFAYFPNCDSGDTLGLNLNGELIPLEDWEKGIECR